MKGDMNKNSAKRMTSLIVISFCAASFAAVSIQACFYFTSLRETARSAEAIMSIESRRAAEELVIQLRKVERAVSAAARDISAGAASPDGAVAQLERSGKENPLIFTAGVASEPAAGDPSEPWYGECALCAPCWSEPFRDKTSNELAVAFAAPFNNPSAGKGMAFATVSLETIKSIAGSFRFGETGYGYIISGKGTFIYHPISEAVESQKTFSEILARTRKTPDAARIGDAAKAALAGRNSAADITNPETGQRFRIVNTHIPDTKWVIGAVFSKDEMSGDTGFLRRQKMWMILWLVIFTALLSAVIFNVAAADPWRLWTVSAVFSVTCIAGVFCIWYIAMTAPFVEQKNRPIFTDAVSLKKFTDGHIRAMANLNKRPAAYISTGIYIQSLEFTGSNDLNITGYVWQKYTNGIHDNIRRGFTMPEARQINIRDSYSSRSGNTEIAGWYFEATIRQQFDYSKYPFDRPNIWIWLRPADFTNNVVLVPDLASYKFLAPASMPGMQEKIALPGYSILGTFFDHEYHIRRTNFGIASRGRMERAPELYYNIVVRRNFITPFVSKLFPLLIMFAILFVVQLMFSQEEEKKKAFGFSALAVMGVIITFFFSTLLSHNSLRQELAADRIIFIENFHFIAYFVLLLAAVKTLLFMGGSRVRLVQYKQGLIPKLLYWPLCTALVFAISFVNFY
jgi:hypothetical protein